MLSMQEKVLIGLVVTFAAVLAANFIIPVSTFEVKLVTSPAGDVIKVPSHEPFNITCETVGDDGKIPSLKWTNKDGNVIPNGIPGVKESGKQSLTLYFTDPKPEDSGNYRCSGIYNNQQNLIKTVKITFYAERPTFETDFELLNAEEGSLVKFNCLAIGNKPLTYEWSWYNKYDPEEVNSTIQVSNFEEGSSLTIQKVTKKHTGTYTCYALNSHGLGTKVYELIVSSSSKNGSSLHAEVGAITSTSVRFLIDTPTIAESIEVKFSETRNKSEFIMKWNLGDTYEVEDLIPGGLYEFQFRTVPSENNEWSSVLTVTLLPDKPEVIFQKLEGNSVKIEWFRKFDDLIRGTTDLYELKYFGVQMQGGNIWIPSECVITIQIPTCGGSTYTISGLSQKVYYEIQLRAHTASGYGEPYTHKLYLTG